MRGSGTPTIASGAIAKFLAMLPAIGLEAQAIFDEAGVDAGVASLPDARVPLPSLYALWEVVLGRVPRADLSLVLAGSYTPGDYGLMGFVLMSCETIGEAIVQAERYMRLWADEPRLHLHGDGRVEVTYGEASAHRPGLHRTIESFLAQIVNGARRVTQRPVAAREVRFRHPAPPHSDGREAWSAFFGGPVRFDQATTEMQLQPEDLALPLPPSPPQLGDFLRGLANETLARRGGASTLVEQVRRIVAEELQRGVPGIDVVARRLGVSGRTLRRRLEDEGETFTEVLDRTRGELAADYVRDCRMPLNEVAFLVGFSDPSAFTRAFKRWTDSTPGAWRQRFRAGG